MDVTETADAWELAAQLRLMVARLNRTLLKKAGANQLSLSHTCVLIRLEREGPNSVSELARAEGMRPQSMSEIIAELDTAGLIRGTPDPADGRRTVISLTDAGWDAIKLSRAERQDWLVHMIGAKFSTAELKQLLATMELLARLI